MDALESSYKSAISILVLSGVAGMIITLARQEISTKNTKIAELTSQVEQLKRSEDSHRQLIVALADQNANPSRENTLKVCSVITAHCAALALDIQEAVQTAQSNSD